MGRQSDEHYPYRNYVLVSPSQTASREEVHIATVLPDGGYMSLCERVRDDLDRWTLADKSNHKVNCRYCLRHPNANEKATIGPKRCYVCGGEIGPKESFYWAGSGWRHQRNCIGE